MLTLIMLIGICWIFGQLLIFGIKAAWGLSKIVLTVFLLPVVLIGLVLGGLFYIAVPLLIIAGVVSCLIRN